MAGRLHHRRDENDDDDDDDDDDGGAELRVFSDSDIRAAIGGQAPAPINPEVEGAIGDADAICVSLLFDYDDVRALMPHLERATGPRFVFESATELMELNRVNTFSMAPTAGGGGGEGEGGGGGGGSPPVVKKILSLFGSSKEEDKLAGYIKLLKVGPDLLRYVPGERAKDLRTWLLAYRYWNQGGEGNVRSLVKLIAGLVRKRGDGGDGTNRDEGEEGGGKEEDLPPLQVTPDVGLIHPLLMAEGGGGGGGGGGGAEHRHERRSRFHFPYDARPKYMESASEYMRWRLSPAFEEMALERGFPMARSSSPSGVPPPPRVAVLLYRKHVVTQQRYVLDLIAMMEESGIIPVPIFINGVEAHAIVRDWLTSTAERESLGKKEKDGGGGGGGGRIAKKMSDRLVDVDAIVSTIGFPLVGGPAGSMEAGRNVALAQELLSSMNVPYVVASPLLLQSIRQWRDNGVLGLQSGTCSISPNLHLYPRVFRLFRPRTPTDIPPCHGPPRTPRYPRPHSRLVRPAGIGRSHRYGGPGRSGLRRRRRRR